MPLNGFVCPHHEQFSLCRAFQSPVTLLIGRRQLAGLVLELLEFLQLRHANVKVKELIIENQDKVKLSGKISSVVINL